MREQRGPNQTTGTPNEDRLPEATPSSVPHLNWSGARLAALTKAPTLDPMSADIPMLRIATGTWAYGRVRGCRDSATTGSANTREARTNSIMPIRSLSRTRQVHLVGRLTTQRPRNYPPGNRIAGQLPATEPGRADRVRRSALRLGEKDVVVAPAKDVPRARPGGNMRGNPGKDFSALLRQLDDRRLTPVGRTVSLSERVDPDAAPACFQHGPENHEFCKPWATAEIKDGLLIVRLARSGALPDRKHGAVLGISTRTPEGNVIGAVPLGVSRSGILTRSSPSLVQRPPRRRSGRELKNREPHSGASRSALRLRPSG